MIGWLKSGATSLARMIRPAQRALPAETLVAASRGINGGVPATIDRTIQRTVMEVKHASQMACDPCGGSQQIGKDPKWAFTLNLYQDLPLSLWVYNCASMLAELCGSIRLVATFNGVPQPDSKLQKLLNRPARGWRQAEWTAARAYHLLLTGTDYLHIERAKVRGQSALRGRGALPASLWPYPQGEFRTELTQTPPHEVLYYVRTEDSLEVSESDCIRTRFVKPNDMSRGLSPLEAAANEARVDINAAAWQAESYHNRAIPDGIMMFDEVLSQSQLDEADARIQQGLSGAGNARRSFAMGSSMKGKWIALSRNAVEMDFTNSRQMNKSFICGTYRVPSVLFDSSDATYANLETARFLLYEQGVLPLNELLIEGLNDELAPEYGAGWAVVADLSQVYAMLPMIRARWETAKIPLDQGVPMDIVSEMFDLAVPSYPGSELGFISSARQPVSLWSTETGGPLGGEGEP